MHSSLFKFRVAPFSIFFLIAFLLFDSLDEDYCLLLGFGLTVAIIRFFSGLFLHSLAVAFSSQRVSNSYIALYRIRFFYVSLSAIETSLFPTYGFSLLHGLFKFPLSVISSEFRFPNFKFLHLKFFHYLISFYSKVFSVGYYLGA